MNNFCWMKGLAKNCLIVFGLSFSILTQSFVFTQASDAQEADTTQNLGPSGLPLPRFVSIKPARVNVRVGPGKNYSVTYSYQRQGLPVEIIQEYDQWRKIRDSDGDEGWVYQSLLSGKRTAMTVPWQKDKTKLTALRRQPNADASTAAEVEPSVIGSIRQCNGYWCELSIGRARGWIKQDQLWGAYPGEKIDN